MTQNSIQYPVTKETIHAYAESIFAPIRRGECVTTVWVPMAGRRMWNKFIIENIHLFEKELPGYSKYLLVYIEPLELTEESISGYLRLMAKSFIDVCEKNNYCKDVVKFDEYKAVLEDDQASYSKLLDTLRSVLKQISNSGLEAVFFIGEFDELYFANSVLYKNLKSIWSQMYPKLHYIFLTRERTTRAENIKKWGELNELILQNIVFVPLLEEKDADEIIRRKVGEYGVKLSPNDEKIIKKLCGGHPFMLCVVIRVLGNHPEQLGSGNLEKFLSEYYELASVAKGILDVRSDNEKKLLQKIVDKGNIDKNDNNTILEAFLNLGLVVKKDGIYKVFSTLFEKAIQTSNGQSKTYEESNSGFRFDQGNGTILWNGQTVEEKFTRQEYSILSKFLQNENKLLTRDEVGEALWGKQSYEKYSDWAIDQLMSKLRKKLDNLGIKDSLKTIRGKGYKFVST